MDCHRGERGRTTGAKPTVQCNPEFIGVPQLAGCHAYGFAWAWSDWRESKDMPTQSRGHGTRRKGQPQRSAYSNPSSTPVLSPSFGTLAPNRCNIASQRLLSGVSAL